jgi:hypothetical protein
MVITLALPTHQVKAQEQHNLPEEQTLTTRLVEPELRVREVLVTPAIAPLIQVVVVVVVTTAAVALGSVAAAVDRLGMTAPK